MNETREQILGRSIDKHISVSAGAGSGKTRVLVNRFIHILEQNPDIDIRSIVAITFTRKAAAEMMKRVIETVEERMKQALKDEHEESVRKWDSIRKKMVAARISTIDSFCTQLVRDFPIEAGVPQNFSPINSSEAQQFRDTCTENVLKEFLDSKHEYNAITHELFRYYKHDSVLTAINALMEKGNAGLSGIKMVMDLTEDEILNKSVQALWTIIKSGLIDLCSYTEELLSFDDGSLIAENKRADFYDFKLSIPHLEWTYSKDFLDSFLDQVKNQQSIVSAFVTKEFKPTVRYRKISNTPLEPWIENNRVAIEHIQGIIKSFIESAQCGMSIKNNDELFFGDKQSLRLTKHVLTIAESALNQYELMKREEGLLEFNDVQSLAIELLSHPEASERIKSSIKYIMIDEFQDTNFVQYELALRLVGRLQGIQDNHDINFYIVGDPKQSIYGFRAADVRVFGKATEDIINANRFEKGMQQDQSENGFVSLSISFRLLPNIIGFVNELFTHLMGNNAQGYEVQYAPMIAGRLINHLLEKHPSLGTISILLHRIQENIEDQTNVDEADLLAKKIKNIVQNKSIQVWDTKKNENNETEHFLRDPSYKDITILYARRTVVPTLMAALRAHDIPYFISGNKGFYKSSAIMDFRSYIQFLNNHADDTALSALLVSPFFSVDVRHLFNAVKGKKNCTMWESFSAYALNNKENEHDFQVVKKAYQTLQDIMNKAERLSLPILLHTMIEMSAWHVIAGSMENGKQNLANAEKLIEIARNFESRGFKNLHDFAEELELRTKYDTDETEAAIVNQDDAVQLMTIHSSKGLEFPIVALYDTNVKETTRNNDKISISENYGLALPTIKQEHVVGNHETIKSVIEQMTKLEQKQKTQAEKKRLLYVALTRAKDHLIISTSLKAGKDFERGSQIEMVRESIAPLRNLHTVEELQSFYSLEHDVLYYDDSLEQPRKETITIPITVETDIEVQSQDQQSIQDQVRHGIQLFGKAKQEYKDEFYSTSQFLLLDSNEKEYRKRYVLGFPGTTPEGGFSVGYDEIQQDVSSAKIGVMIHEVLEGLKAWIHQEGNLDEAMLDATIQRVKEDHMFGYDCSENVMSRIRNECLNIAGTNLLKEYAPHLQHSKTEFKLSIPMQDDFFVAVFDALMQSSNGEYELWDWKTNNCQSDEDMNALCKHYQPQMRHYLYMLSLLHPNQQEYKARLLFTRKAKKSAEDQEWTREIIVRKEEMNSIEQELLQYIEKAKHSMLL